MQIHNTKPTKRVKRKIFKTCQNVSISRIRSWKPNPLVSVETAPKNVRLAITEVLWASLWPSDLCHAVSQLEWHLILDSVHSTNIHGNCSDTKK